MYGPTVNVWLLRASGQVFWPSVTLESQTNDDLDTGIEFTLKATRKLSCGCSSTRGRYALRLASAVTGGMPQKYVWTSRGCKKISHNGKGNGIDFEFKLKNEDLLCGCVHPGCHAGHFAFAKFFPCVHPVACH